MCGPKDSVPVDEGKKNNVEFGTNKVMEYSEGVKFFEIHIQTFVTGGLAIFIIVGLIGLIGLIWECWWHRLATMCGATNQGQGRGFVAEYRQDGEEREARGTRWERGSQQSSSDLPTSPRGSPNTERRNSRMI